MNDIVKTSVVATQETAGDLDLPLLILHASLDSMFILDTAGSIMHLNVVAERIFGVKEAEVRGKSFDIFFAKEDFSNYKKFLAGYNENATKQPDGQIISMIGKDSVKIKAAVAMVSHPLKGSANTCTVVIVKDMSENMNLIRQKNEMEHQYTEAVFAQSHYEEQATQVVGMIEQLAIEKDKVEESKRIIEYQAAHDPLTSLGNRLLMQRIFIELLDSAKARKAGLGFIYIDLDNFKKVNDHKGHAAGDRLLCDAARRIEESVGTDDIAIRLGGDEFAIIISVASDTDGKSVYEKAEKILHALKFEINGKETPIHVTASIGVALYPRDGDTLDMLLNSADTTMYRAKNAGKGRVF